MADDWGAYFQARPNNNDWSAYFPNAISEAEANRTFTPEEQAKVDLANGPQFGAGTARRMAEYEGLSPTDAAAKYRSGWADTLGGILDTISDSRKLASVAGDAASAGVQAISHPIDTANRIGRYYYENPDTAATDAAFALFPGRQLAEKGAGAVARQVTPTSMPRGSIRGQEELLRAGGKRMNEAKKTTVANLGEQTDLTPVVPPQDIIPAFTAFHARLGEKGVRINKKLHPKTYDAFQEFTNFIRPKPMQKSVRPATMLDLHEVRQLAQNAADDINPKTMKPTPDAMLANELLDTIDNIITQHPEGAKFMQGKNEYARALKSRAILKLIDDAKNTKLWDNGDHASAIRGKINSFLNSKQARFLTEGERKELYRIKRKGFAETIGGQGSLSPMALTIGRILEGILGIPMGGLYVVGKLARESVNIAKPARIERMAERIRAGE